jgi:hypothetical protein
MFATEPPVSCGERARFGTFLFTIAETPTINGKEADPAGAVPTTSIFLSAADILEIVPTTMSTAPKNVRFILFSVFVIIFPPFVQQSVCVLSFSPDAPAVDIDTANSDYFFSCFVSCSMHKSAD